MYVFYALPGIVPGRNLVHSSSAAVRFMVSRSQSEVCTAGAPNVLPDGIYPASLAQRRLWFLEQLQGPTSAYNVHTGLWLYGPLDIPALQTSLQTIVDRHETLRTCFSLVHDQLLQVVTPELLVNIQTADFAGETDPYPPAFKLACSEVNRPFDLSQSPLMRLLLMRIRAEEHVLLCTMHHSITDATSMQLFAKELATLYQAFSKGTTADLPELAVQYGDYAEWQQASLSSEQLQTQLRYWEQKLNDAPKVLELPSDAPRAEGTPEGTSWAYLMPSELMASVKVLAIRNNATLFTVLLALFKVLLYRYSGQPDLLVGVPMAGRNQVETEPLIGFFVDTLVLRDDLSGNPPFQQVVANVRETTLAAFANAEVPFDKVVERLQPERDLSYNPIFQVMFSVIKSAIRSHQFGDLSAYPYVVSTNAAILDLFASFIEDSDGKWWLQFDFNTTLFRKERITRMSEDVVALLRAIVDNPNARIDDIVVPHAPRKTSLLKLKVDARLKATPSNGHIPSSTEPQKPISDAGDLTNELVLTEIWKEVLGLPRIGPRENFFDLGGHSLLAARLIRQVQDATGRKIPISAIFRAPTIESFADLLRRETLFAPDPILMKLRSGSSPIPFFAVAAPGVDSLGFGLLARNLKREQAMYKLQSPGSPIAGRPFEKEELQNFAHAYLDAMRTVQPRGPYCLGAMCAGVQIAQQMVLKLEAAGEEVGLFVIFDTWVLENSYVRSLWALDYYLQRMKTLRQLPSAQRFTMIRQALNRRSQRITRTSNGRSNGQGTENGHGWEKVYWPGHDFQEPQFNAPILLFKRPKQPYIYVRDRQMGWGARTRGGVEICEVDCLHYEMLRPPYVRYTAARLHARLDEINRRADSEIKESLERGTA